MGIKIRLVGDRYTVIATASSIVGGQVSDFASAEPISQREVIDRLREHGWHQQDIGDAFYEAPPGWSGRAIVNGGEFVETPGIL